MLSVQGLQITMITKRVVLYNISKRNDSPQDIFHIQANKYKTYTNCVTWKHYQCRIMCLPNQCVPLLFVTFKCRFLKASFWRFFWHTVLQLATRNGFHSNFCQGHKSSTCSLKWQISLLANERFMTANTKRNERLFQQTR